MGPLLAIAGAAASMAGRMAPMAIRMGMQAGRIGMQATRGHRGPNGEVYESEWAKGALEAQEAADQYQRNFRTHITKPEVHTKEEWARYKADEERTRKATIAYLKAGEKGMASLNAKWNEYAKKKPVDTGQLMHNTPAWELADRLKKEKLKGAITKERPKSTYEQRNSNKYSKYNKNGGSNKQWILDHDQLVVALADAEDNDYVPYAASAGADNAGTGVDSYVDSLDDADGPGGAVAAFDASEAQFDQADGYGSGDGEGGFSAHSRTVGLNDQSSQLC